MSAAGPASAPTACSGAMYSGVPTVRPVHVRLPSASRARQAEVGDLGDRPGQRAIRGRAGVGLEQDVGRLQVAVDDPLRCATSIARARVSTRPAAACGGQGSPPSRSASVPPSTHSIARKGRPSWSPTS